MVASNTEKDICALLPIDGKGIRYSPPIEEEISRTKHPAAPVSPYSFVVCSPCNAPNGDGCNEQMKKEETTKDEEMQLIVSSCGVKELVVVKWKKDVWSTKKEKSQQSQINVRINGIAYVRKVVYFDDHITILNFPDDKEIANFLRKAVPSSQDGLILQPNLKLLPETETIVESTEVKTCGFPIEICKPTITHGRISNVDTKFLTYDATTDPGSSGGPVVRKNGDFVLGVHKGRTGSNKSFRQVVNVSDLRELIKEAKSKADNPSLIKPLDISEQLTSLEFTRVWINNSLQGIAAPSVVVDEHLHINIKSLPSDKKKCIIS